MTSEHVIVVDLSDIRAFVFECTHCHGRLVAPAGENIPHGDGLIACKFCGHTWATDYTATEPLRAVAKAIQAGQQLDKNKGLQFTLRLQLSGDVARA